MSSKIYGHIVGANPLGEAYVVPLAYTLDQIKDDLGVPDVQLADAEELFAYVRNSAHARDLQDSLPKVAATSATEILLKRRVRCGTNSSTPLHGLPAAYGKPTSPVVSMVTATHDALQSSQSRLHHGPDSESSGSIVAQRQHSTKVLTSGIEVSDELNAQPLQTRENRPPKSSSRLKILRCCRIY